MQTIYDPMVYQPQMQQLDSHMFEAVQEGMVAFEQVVYTEADVKAALRRDLQRTGLCGTAFTGSRTIFGTNGRKGKTGTGKAFWQLCAAIHTALYFQLL